jgi:tetratricopeptide (TPR) repeat protein
MSAVAEVKQEEILAISADLNLVDEQNPWLGLDSFDEETRQFFHGREEEIAELARRVQRKTLAILFGQSGLGKTSILRAGIVPRLRREGFCPVYVRIDYARESPAPSQQIKQAIFKATEGAGRWTRPGSAVPGESLWEFLHHRDDYLVDETGKTLTPLLIFDQFEEIFTLGQDDDFGRRRAEEFVQDLADLVENRPPKSLELMLDQDDTLVERFDFERADYRILIALREDYLAHLEGFKGVMPSITQNRMRLARMTGQQALAAVLKPGGKLVSEEVAESIVRFIAGGAELRNAEVEPSLLSLVCRELNNARVAQGRSEISADLLAGSRDTILNEFYERALTDQPEGVRRFIEDEMLTESGFRESLAEERVLRAFSAAGAAPSALAVLVNRRLLRIEERLDMRRVELTHDVLCAVVKESRDARHEREAREEMERQFAEQRAREEATRKALVRARKIAAGCAALAVIAVAGAAFGYFNMKRAQEAEAHAQQTKALAESARGEAEKLLVYLLDDFYLELEPVGRLDIVANLSKRALDYYAGLPEALRTADTQRNQALAMVRYGYAARNLARLDEAEKNLSGAVAILTKLNQGGDNSENTLIGLSLGLSGLARVYDSTNRYEESAQNAAKSVEILKPAMAASSPSARLLRTYGIVTNYRGFAQMRRFDEDGAIVTLQASRDAFRRIDGLALTDLPAAAAYTEASGWLMEALLQARKFSDAQLVGDEAARIATGVLELRPGHMSALRARALINGNLADAFGQQHQNAKSLVPALAAVRDWETFVKLDPGNVIAWNNLGAARSRQATSLEELGRISEELAVVRSTLDVEPHLKASPGLMANLILDAGWVRGLEIELGVPESARDRRADARRVATAAVAGLPEGAFIRDMLLARAARIESNIAITAGKYAEARDASIALIRRVEPLKAASAGDTGIQNLTLVFAYADLGEAEYMLGNYAGAEAAMRKSLEYRARQKSKLPVDRPLGESDHKVLLALAIARQGRGAEARSILEPEINLHREVVRAGGDEQSERLGYARALLALAVANPADAKALLAEAMATLDRLTPDMRRLRTTGVLRSSIAQEAAKRR